MGRIIIVDENDNAIGYKEKDKISQKDIYRVSALWITNSKDEILLARRVASKKNSPRKWGPAVAGTVEEGETYYSNIIKESEEEIGIGNIFPSEESKMLVTGKQQFFVQFYSLQLEKDITFFKLKEDEVESIQWFRKTDFQARFKSHREEFLWNMDQWVEKFLN